MRTANVDSSISFIVMIIITAHHFPTQTQTAIALLVWQVFRSSIDDIFVKLRQGSGKDRQGMALKAKGLQA